MYPGLTLGNPARPYASLHPPVAPRVRRLYRSPSQSSLPAQVLPEGARGRLRRRRAGPAGAVFIRRTRVLAYKTLAGLGR